MYAFGAQFVEVRVDADLGQVRVSRMVGAFDAGRVSLRMRRVFLGLVGQLELAAVTISLQRPGREMTP